jgi:hypothetical protein
MANIALFKFISDKKIWLVMFFRAHIIWQYGGGFHGYKTGKGVISALSCFSLEILVILFYHIEIFQFLQLQFDNFFFFN